MAQTRQTFNEMLKGMEETHSETLMKRARRANRIAKTVRGKSRRNAYEVKAKALSFLVRILPEWTDIRKDIILTDFVVVELKGTRSGLHCPIARLEGIGA